MDKSERAKKMISVQQRCNFATVVFTWLTFSGNFQGAYLPK